MFLNLMRRNYRSLSEEVRMQTVRTEPEAIVTIASGEIRAERIACSAPQLPLKLFSDAATFDNGTVTFDIVLEKVVEELSSLTDHLLHTSAGVVVLGVLLEVLGELADSLGEDSDLYLGRTGIAFVSSEFFDEILLVFLSDHFLSPFKIIFFGINSAGGW